MRRMHTGQNLQANKNIGSNGYPLISQVKWSAKSSQHACEATKAPAVYLLYGRVKNNDQLSNGQRAHQNVDGVLDFLGRDQLNVTVFVIVNLMPIVINFFLRLHCRFKS